VSQEVVITFLKSGGPGGQHRNKTETGVRLLHVPTGIVVTATERRSRRQNLEVAFGRLRKKLEALQRPRKKRVATNPTRASRARRIPDKTSRGELRQGRRRPGEES
jgi:protein subunit release factor B